MQRLNNRWLTATATYDDTIAGAAVLIEAGLGQGLSGFGSKTENSDFTYAFAQGSISRDVTDSLSAQVQIAGQYGFTELPWVIRFDLGGEPLGRAFDSGSVTGDDGIAMAFELQREVKTDINWLTHLSLFGFVDYGAVWNPTDRDYEFASLGSTGAGVRAVAGHFNAMAYIATPYKDEPELGAAEGTRFRVAVGARF